MEISKMSKTELSQYIKEQMKSFKGEIKVDPASGPKKVRHTKLSAEATKRIRSAR